MTTLGFYSVCKSVLRRGRELEDLSYLGRLGVWGLGLLATKGFDSEGITPWEFWCGSCEGLGGAGCGSLRGCVGCWESGWRIDSFSLVLFLCSANNTSNRFLLPWTALRWVKECVLHVKERVQGFLVSRSMTPQCMSGSNSLSVKSTLTLQWAHQTLLILKTIGAISEDML